MFKNISYAQEIGAKIDFFGYADNREYSSSFTTPKTIFGTIVSPQVYIKLEEKHKLTGGIHYNQDFGKTIDNKSIVNPIIYYNYQDSKFDFALGFIPRHEKLKDIPKLVLADTFFYDRPNIEGMFFQYKNKGVKQSIFIDWLSNQSYTQRERFVVGISGKYDWGLFYFKNNGLLYHNALTSNDLLDEHIQDNAVLTINLGIDLTNRTNLDSLTFDVGAVVAYDRLRTSYTNSAVGFISNLYLEYKRFYIGNTLYLGQALNLPNGDPFYKRDKYDRLDLGWIPFKGKNVEGKFAAVFHFTPGKIDNQQTFTLRYNFAQAFYKK